MIEVGQYVRACLAEGIAAAIPSTDGFEAQLGREGVVTEVRRGSVTLVIEDFFGHEHVCHLNGAVAVDTNTLDPYLRDWATNRAAELGVGS